jgi:hypothetical protein
MSGTSPWSSPANVTSVTEPSSRSA